MFSRFYTKSVLCLLVVSLLIPSVLLFYPQKASAAGADCMSQIAVYLGLNKVQKALTGSSVPVENKVLETGQTGTFVKQCIIQPLIVQLAKAMLYNITASTVAWINSGFHGNPGFVQDLKGLFNDTADSVIGDFLRKEAPFLCAPFAFQVRIQLAQTYMPYRQKSSCTLTQAQNNINGFINNNGGVGWQNWIDVTTVPQNNQFGALVIAQDEVSKRIVNAQYINKTYLDWGKGFRNMERCDAQDENGDPVCTPTTPGAIVEAMLQKTVVDVPIDQLGLANDINNILDALANQFTKQIVNGTVGLLGGRTSPNTSQNPGFGAVNYDQAINPGNNDPALSAAINQSINQSNADLAPLFTNSGSIDAGGTITPNPDVTTSENNTVGLSVISITPTVTNTTDLSYEVDLISNYSVSGMTVKMTLKKNGAPMSFYNAFISPQQITFGRTGTYATRSINSSTDTNVEWVNVSANQDSNFVFRFLAKKKSGAEIGTYTLETTLSNATGEPIDTATSTFTMQ